MNRVDHHEIMEGMFTDAIEGIVVCDSDGRIIMSNPKANEMFGYRVDEMKGMSAEDLIPARLRPGHLPDNMRPSAVMEPRSIGSGKGLLARRKDAQEFPVDVSLSYVKSQSRLLAVAFIVDTSDRKKKDDELKKANEMLKKTSFELSKLNQELEQKVHERTLELAELVRKLTESKREVDMALVREKELNTLKSRFISTASHEFRTPLATIMSSVSLTGKYAENLDKEKMLKHIDRVKKSVNHLTEILDDFLSLDKLEEGVVVAHLENVCINGIITDVIEEIRAIAKAGQRIQFEEHLENTMVYIDRIMFRNIMINLISNAIKYSNENTSIKIGARNNMSNLYIDISDHGIGIPLEDQPHIFERFFRATNTGNTQGTGLGMNIVKRYVELLNGDISFKSVPEKGTRFSLRFPLS